MLLQGKYYNVSDPLIVGSAFLPAGLGNMGKVDLIPRITCAILKRYYAVGSFATGWLSDWFIIRGKRLRGGKWVPEDRLKAIWPGALVTAPISVLGYGLTTQF